MKPFAVILLLFCRLAYAESLNPDLPVLLDEISKICGDRWEVAVDSRTNISVRSKEKALGEAPGYNFGPGEDHYSLYFRFRIVEAFDANAANQARVELKELREKGDRIEHTNMMGQYNYTPRNADQWALVLSIRMAEAKVEDIPTHRYKSVFLSERYSMDFFAPNKTDQKAVQYKNDIVKLYALLEKVAR